MKYKIYSVAIPKSINNILGIGAIALVLVLLGNIIILAGGEFEKETDSNKIYTYSESAVASVSCIASIIALMGM